MDVAIILLGLILFIVACVAIAVLNIRKEHREVKMNKDSCTITQITINCDDDGNVTVITDDPSKVRVERRS
jgi:uncharacterized protein YpmS